MLRSISLENFKAFGHRTVIPLAPITLIYGQNSAGKSTILQALSLLKQSRENRDVQALLLPRTDNGLVDLGSFDELLFDHDQARALSVRLAFDHGTQNDKDRHLPALAHHTLGLEFAFTRRSPDREITLRSVDVCGDSNSTYIARFMPVRDPVQQMRGDNATFGDAEREQGSPGITEFQFSTLGDVETNAWQNEYDRIRARRHGIHKERLEQLEDLRRLASSRSPSRERQREQLEWIEPQLAALTKEVQLFGKDFSFVEYLEWVNDQALKLKLLVDGFIPIRAVSTDDQFEMSRYMYGMSNRLPDRNSEFTNIGQLAVRAGKLTEQGLASVFPLGPFRRPPSRWYVFTGTTPRHVGYQGNSVPDLLFRRPHLLHETNSWFQRLELGYRLEVGSLGLRGSDLFELRLFDTRRATPVRVGLSDVGFGISQILPLVVQSLMAEKQIITIEQPEVHVHPKLQADLGDLLAHAIRHPTSNQFLVETHSEHLALRMLKLVRNKVIKPSDLAVIYVSREPNGSAAYQIRVDEDGDFVDAFPGGFFPERLREL